MVDDVYKRMSRRELEIFADDSYFRFRLWRIYAWITWIGVTLISFFFL